MLIFLCYLLHTRRFCPLLFANALHKKFIVHLKGKWQTHVRNPFIQPSGASPQQDAPQQQPIPAKVPVRGQPVLPSLGVSQRFPPPGRAPGTAPPPGRTFPPPSTLTTSTAFPPPSTPPPSNTFPIPRGPPPRGPPPPSSVATKTAPPHQKPTANFSSKLDAFEKNYGSQRLLNSTDNSELDSAAQQLVSLFADYQDEELRNEMKDIDGRRLIELIGSLAAVLSKV